MKTDKVKNRLLDALEGRFGGCYFNKDSKKPRKTASGSEKIAIFVISKLTV